MHEKGIRISQALRSRGFITDFRSPNIIRVSPMPLYNTHHEIWQVVLHLRHIVDKQEYKKFSKKGMAIA